MSNHAKKKKDRMTIHAGTKKQDKLIKMAGPNRVKNKKTGQRLQLKKSRTKFLILALL